MGRRTEGDKDRKCSLQMKERKGARHEDTKETIPH
jgi:hypothetical protein